MDDAFETLDMLLEIEHENIHEIITYDTSKGETSIKIKYPSLNCCYAFRVRRLNQMAFAEIQ